MSSEIPWLPLEDLVEDIIDRRGVTPLKLGGDFTESGHRVISAKLLKAGRVDLQADEPRYVNAAVYAKWMKGPLLRGDVLMTSEAPLGELAFVDETLDWCLGQRLFAIRPKKHLLDGCYAFYALQTPKVREDLLGRATGTTVQGIRQSELRRVKLPVPDLPFQVAAAGALKALDDRIALLRETNATLEAIAQALFKSWFVDFDPVRAKSQGLAPAGMDEATAALFPDGFEESEIGEVPRGWSVLPVGDAVECVGGATPDTKDERYWSPPEHAWTTPKDLSGLASPVLLRTERMISAQGLARIGSGLMPAGTLLMSSRAPIGYLAIAQLPLAVNQGYIAMLPGGRLSPLYMLFWCRQNMELIKARANGSTFMEISKKAFRPIPVLVPSSRVIEAFVAIASPLFSRLVSNEQQAQTLATLRDTLLPRLISGQLRLPDAEALAAAA